MQLMGFASLYPSYGSNPSRTDAFREPLDRGLGSALAMGNAERLEAGFDHAERAQNHRRVDVAHMGDAERLPLQVADADAEHHAAFFLAITMQRNRIGAAGHHHRRYRVRPL